MSKANDFTGKGFPGADQQGKNPGELLCHVVQILRIMGVNFPGCLWTIVLLGPYLI